MMMMIMNDQVIKGKEKSNINKLIMMDCAANIFTVLIRNRPDYRCHFSFQILGILLHVCFQVRLSVPFHISRSEYLCHTHSFFLWSFTAWITVLEGPEQDCSSNSTKNNQYLSNSTKTTNTETAMLSMNCPPA